jgi:hypothetical protein
VENKPLQTNQQKQQNPSNSCNRLLAKKIVFTVGLSGFALGFLVLGFVDAYGQNWAGMVSPFLIIGGVIAIVVALLLKEE